MKEDTKDKGKKLKKIVICFVLVCIVALGGILFWRTQSKTPSDTKVFSVANQDVYLDEVHLYFLQNVANLNITMEDLQNTTMQDGSDLSSYYKDEIMQMIMRIKVEYTLAMQKDIVLSEKEEKQIRLDATEYIGKTNGRVLQKYGIKQDCVMRVYRERYLAKKLEETVTESVEVENKNYSTIYVMMFPLIEMDGAGDYVRQEDGVSPVMLSEEKRAEQKEHADAALTALREGADAEEIVKQYAIEAYSGEESNIEDSFDESLVDYIRPLKDGECSDVIDLSSSYVIIKMLKKNDEQLAEQIMSHYGDDVKQEALSNARKGWFKELSVGDMPEHITKYWNEISLFEYAQFVEG